MKDNEKEYVAVHLQGEDLKNLHDLKKYLSSNNNGAALRFALKEAVKNVVDYAQED